jgi:CubicO group peptidase (beta-lactamase class C family)
MLRRSFMASMLALPAAPALAAARPDWSLVDAALSPYVDRGELAGMSILVMQDGKVVHTAAFGKRDVASGAPMRMDTIVRAFSMTKPVSAVAMGVLRDEGRWKPEDPIAKHLPELADRRVFNGLGPDGKPILEPARTQPTMGQLMTHTAGFAYGLMPGPVDDLYRANSPIRAPNSKEALARLATLPLAYEPGTKWVYSLSMDVQGLVVERLSGLSLAEFMDRRIFTPLKMADTGFYVPPGKRDRFATLYEWRNNALQVPSADGLFSSPYAEPPGFASGGGGLVTTAGDYARFGQMLLNGGSLDGAKVLTPKTAREIMTSHLSPALVNGKFGIGMQQIRPGYEYGWNGVVVTDPAAAKVAMGKGSYLWDGAAGTWFWVDPERKLVFVGLVQRLMGPGFPPLQPVSQEAVKRALGA